MRIEILELLIRDGFDFLGVDMDAYPGFHHDAELVDGGDIQLRLFNISLQVGPAQSVDDFLNLLPVCFFFFVV